jgi:hypothetical protein
MPLENMAGRELMIFANHADGVVHPCRLHLIMAICVVWTYIVPPLLVIGLVNVPFIVEETVPIIGQLNRRWVHAPHGLGVDNPLIYA